MENDKHKISQTKIFPDCWKVWFKTGKECIDRKKGNKKGNVGLEGKEKKVEQKNMMEDKKATLYHASCF